LNISYVNKDSCLGVTKQELRGAISLLFSDVCTSNNLSPGSLSQTNTIIIIVVCCVVGAALVTMIVLLSIPSTRKKIFPYRDEEK